MEQVCSDAMAQLREIVAAKARGAERTELKELLAHTAIQLIKLRQAAKAQVEEVETFKANTTQCKSDVEISSLQLQNLLYEKNYYLKEIASCRNFQ